MFDWIGDTIDSAFGAVGDAFEWVGEKISEAWDNDLVKIAAIVAVGYFAFFMLPEMMAATATETAIVAETGILSAGATDLTLASSGMQLGSSAAAEGALMTTAEIVGTDAAAIGALEGTTAAAAIPGLGDAPEVINTLASDGRLAAAVEGAAPYTAPTSAPVSGTSGIDLTLAGADTGTGMTVGSGAGAGDTGVLNSMSAWAEKNPMMAYGGMMAGGQAVSGYMQGKQMEEMEQQRLDEEAAARNRQNIWGVNYGTGEGGISAGDRLKDLNRDYFDSPAPINPAVQDYQIASARQAQGVLDQVNTRANPTRKTYIN